MSQVLVALWCWTAVGARIGRMFGRVPTELRLAVTSAMVFLAVACTIRVRAISSMIDDLGDSEDLGQRMFLAMAVAFAVSGAAGAVSVMPFVSRGRFAMVGFVALAVIVVVATSAVYGIVIPGRTTVTVCLVLMLGASIRYVGASPLGRGLGLMSLGYVTLLASAVRALINGDFPLPGDEPSKALWSAGSILIATGVMWVPVERWVRAYITLRRVEPLHALLVQRFPEVDEATADGPTTIPLRASDAVAQVMDALYLQAGGGMFENHVDPPPQALQERIDTVVQWIKTPLEGPVLGVEWITPPSGVSTRAWVETLARAVA